MNIFKIQPASCSTLQTSPRIQGICHLSQFIFWLDFICYILCMTWHYTYHPKTSFLTYQQFHNVLKLLAFIAIINIVFLCGYSKQQLIEITVLLVVFALARYYSQNDDGFLFYSMAIALSCRRIHPGDLRKKLFSIYLLVFFGVIFLYSLGIFSSMNLNESRPRYNLGFSHYNTLGLVVLCILMLWILLRYTEFIWIDYLLCTISFIFVWKVPNSRTSALCILLLSIGVFFSKHFDIFRLHIVKYMVLLLYPGMAVFSFLCTFYYSPDNPIFSLLNSLLSGRLSFGQSFLKKYSIPLLGQQVRRINFAQAKKAGIPPEILDNGYLRILLQLGLLTFIIFLIIITYIFYRAFQEKNYAVIICLIVIAFYNLSEYFMTCLFANPFLFFFTFYRYGPATEANELINSSILTSSKREQIMKKCGFYEKFIDMKQYLHYLALHWISILLVAVLVALAACGLNLKNQIAAQKQYNKKYPDNTKEITLTLNENEIESLKQYLSDVRLLETYSAYKDNSFYMSIDAANVPHFAQTYTFSSTQSNDSTVVSNTIRAAMNSMVQTAKTDDFFKAWISHSELENLTPENLRELFTISIANATQITLEICAPDETILSCLSEAFTSVWETDTFEDLKKSNPDLQMIPGTSYVYTCRDTKIRDVQANILNQVSTYTTKKNNSYEKLSENAKKYFEKYDASSDIALGDPITYTQKTSAPGISKKKTVLAGMTAGGIAFLLSIAFWLIMYLLTDHIWGRRTIAITYSLPLIGSFVPDTTNEFIHYRTNHIVWKFYNNHLSRNGQTNQELTFSLRCILGLTAGKKLHHLLVLSDSLTACPEISSQLHEFLTDTAAENVTIVSAKELVSPSTAKDNLMPDKIDAVLFAPIIGHSTHKQMEHVIELSSHYTDKVLGYVMIE